MRPRVRTGMTGLLAALMACGGGDTFTPTPESVTGSYSAAAFTATAGAGSIDLLALGATVQVTLALNGTTTGHLFVPGGGENGADLDADLAGTWTLSGRTVTFNQSADTFIRDVDFTAGRNQLIGEGTFNGFFLRLVLAKN